MGKIRHANNWVLGKEMVGFDLAAQNLFIIIRRDGKRGRFERYFQLPSWLGNSKKRERIWFSLPRICVIIGGKA